MLVRAPVVLATARSAHNAIETALEEHPARTGQAERCRNQESCKQTRHENIFLSQWIPRGNCVQPERQYALSQRIHAYNQPTLSRIIAERLEQLRHGSDRQGG
jgi:hypothetical protein